MEPNKNDQNTSPEAPIQPPSPDKPPITPDPTPTVPLVAGPSQPAVPNMPQPLNTQPPAASFGNPVVSGGDAPVAPASPVAAAPTPNRGRFSKKVLLLIFIPLLLVGGAAAFYFGYYANPSVLYKQALTNTGKGYDKLVDYTEEQAKAEYKSYTGEGSYKADMAGMLLDGEISFKSDEKDMQLNLDAGFASSRVKGEARLFSTDNDSAEVYFKASGLDVLGEGSPEMAAAISKLEDSWVVIDSELLDRLTGDTAAAAGASSELKEPSREQMLDVARAFGKVNQEYLFSTDKEKAVLKVVKNVGKEEVDGHNTYHYQVALDKDNVKKYLKAQQSAIKSSKFNDWLKEMDADLTVENVFDQLVKAADDIKESDKYDLWADADQRVIYKVRFSDSKNPAAEYLDLGLDYKGGDKYPFFLAAKSSFEGVETTFNLVLTLNTQTDAYDFKFDVDAEGEGGGNMSLDFKVEPGNENVTVERPAGARPINDVLAEFGLPDLETLLYESEPATTEPADLPLGTSIQ